ncbi:MAG: hypothetical protein M0Z36_04205 [Thermaerobacter sp.]|nr:hypothetical protein [Thermaerobacter sp.]
MWFTSELRVASTKNEAEQDIRMIKLYQWSPRVLLHSGLFFIAEKTRIFRVGVPTASP